MQNGDALRQMLRFFALRNLRKTIGPEGIPIHSTPDETLLQAGKSHDRAIRQRAAQKKKPSRAAIAHSLRAEPLLPWRARNLPFRDSPPAARQIGGRANNCATRFLAAPAASPATPHHGAACTLPAGPAELVARNRHVACGFSPSPEKCLLQAAIDRNNMTGSLRALLA